MIRYIAIAITLATGIVLGIWAKPWFAQVIQMTPDNTNNLTRILTITVAIASMLALIICGWFIGKILDKRGDLE